MHFQLSAVLSIASAAVAVASPTWQDASWEHALASRGHPKQTSTRPNVQCHPKTPHTPPPSPPARTKICYVKSVGNGTDDSPAILSALHECNNGGHVVFSKGVTYLVGTAMDWTFLKHIDLDIQGEILFSDNTTYWQANSFPFVFQNVTSFFKLGGEDVFIYGGGTLNGNGQVWYDLYASDIYTLRPVLIGIDGLKDSVLTDLVLRYSPEYYNFIANSSNVVFNNIDIAGGSTSKNLAKNTDGWDTYRSDSIVIQNSVINNGDDCVSFKPNSTNILVQNLICTGSHGISVGSLGQYVGEYDIVQNVYVYNTSLHNATDGARIKVWPNTASAASGDLQGGGGDGMVSNITYDTMYIDNVDYAIEVDQCYGQKNLTLCLEYPSPLTIKDIVFKNFTGKTSKKYQPEIGTFACSSTSVCNNIVASGINVLSPNGTDEAYCLNVDETALDVTCTTNYLGFN
ncbi:PGX, glycoside hydrolase family 28 protein [Sclerotinia borealis F-4128]|uniref:galacturonan 1,4-alpha-galacturonidase n=1 Tax=Sclerotinia borealis (strain F-4128) TaxID=1432307 RepID=W9CSB4_SCLBF|nr:PGX, glycoside hydrolase family 28 protein [Sclerotinia borealis F-4128]